MSKPGPLEYLQASPNKNRFSIPREREEVSKTPPLQNRKLFLGDWAGLSMFNKEFGLYRLLLQRRRMKLRSCEDL